MHRIALISASLLLVLIGTASADRLGGAYRGPFPYPDAPDGRVGPDFGVPRRPHGRGAYPEVMAYWPFYYEHHKELILADRITARRLAARGESGVPSPELVDKVFAVLEAALKHPASEVRDAAILALGKTGREAAVPILAKCLTDEDPELREDALLALGFGDDHRNQWDLLQIVIGKKNQAELRGYTALALALMDGRTSLRKMRLAFAGSHPGRLAGPIFMTQACWALALMGDAEDVGLLIQTVTRVEDDWFHARGAAAIALGLIAAESSVEPLLGMAATAEDPLTRAFSIVALGWLVDRDPVPRIPLLYRQFNYRARTALIDEVMSCL